MLLRIVLWFVVHPPTELNWMTSVALWVQSLSVWTPSTQTNSHACYICYFINNGCVILLFSVPISTTHLDLPFINRRAFLHSSLCETPPSTKPLVYFFGESVCIFIPLKWLGLKWLEVFFMLGCFQSCIIFLCALDWRHFKDCHLHAINRNPSLWPFIFLGYRLSHSVFCQRNLYESKHHCSVYGKACCWFPFFHS